MHLKLMIEMDYSKDDCQKLIYQTFLHFIFNHQHMQL